VLPGITRRVVLELAETLQMAAAEAPLLPADLARAAEIFLTNSLFEIRSIGTLDGRELAPPNIAAQLRAAYRALV
jgi:branched-subunit amino acid aminotransferase/4-amino-4-deoxychorismate lyase